MTMARFTLFESDGASRRSQSSSSTTTSSSSSTSSSPSLNAARQQTSSDRRILSNPAIAEVSYNSQNLESISSGGVHESSMRTSHSDTNLMERFRRGNLLTNFIGAHKSFTLQKRKSKKEKKHPAPQTSTTEIPSGHHQSSKEILVPTDQSSTTELTSFAQITTETLQPKLNGSQLHASVESLSASCSHSSPSPASVPHVPSSSSDYLLHSHSLECFEQQHAAQQKPPRPSSLYQKSSPQSSSNVSFKTKSSQFSKQRSTQSAAYDQSLKKSWLYPMTFMNCCLTRTDSLPDVHFDVNASAKATTTGRAPSTQVSCARESTNRNEQRLEQHLAQMVSMEDMPDQQQQPLETHSVEHMIDERALINNLNELFLGAAVRRHTSSPNQMISPNASSYFEEVIDEETELQQHAVQPFGNNANSMQQLAMDNDQFQELRRLFNNHQPPILPILSSFSVPDSAVDTDHFFPPSNYPLQMGRMFGGSRQQLESGGGQQEWRSTVQNPHSISNINNSILPYPPPAHLRSQRHYRAQNNPIHTQIDYINCLVPDLSAISNCSFYWGKMDRYEAERLLEGKPEGTFLLRDSAQEDHLFSVSFRRFDRSLHARIEQWKHRFSFDSHDPGVYSSDTVTGLIEHYKDPSHCMFFEPMLTKPLNRTTTFSLQHLARVTVCDAIAYDTVNQLPLPNVLKSFLKEYHYRQKVRTKHFDEFTYLSNYYQQE